MNKVSGPHSEARAPTCGGAVMADLYSDPDRAGQASAHTAYGGIPRTERSYTSGPARAMSSAVLAANDAAGG